MFGRNESSNKFIQIHKQITLQKPPSCRRHQKKKGTRSDNKVETVEKNI